MMSGETAHSASLFGPDATAAGLNSRGGRALTRRFVLPKCGFVPYILRCVLLMLQILVQNRLRTVHVDVGCTRRSAATVGNLALMDGPISCRRSETLGWPRSSFTDRVFTRYGEGVTHTRTTTAPSRGMGQAV